MSAILEPAFEWFRCDRIITKAIAEAGERRKGLAALGFMASLDPLIGHEGMKYFDYFVFEKA